MKKKNNKDVDDLLDIFNRTNKSNIVRKSDYIDSRKPLTFYNVNLGYEFISTYKQFRGIVLKNKGWLSAKKCNHNYCSYNSCVYEQAKNHLEEIKDIYIKSENSRDDIAEFLGVSKTLVHHIVLDLDLYNKYSSQRKEYMYKKEFCYNPFSDVSKMTANEHWLLGYILADGSINIRKKGGRKSLRLYTTDLELLKYSCDIFKLDYSHIKSKKSNRNIKSGETHTYYILDIYDNNICDSLISLGVKPRKSYMGSSEIKFNEKYKFDFLRGLFDGDGTATKGKFGVVGHPTYMKWLYENYFSFCKFRTRKSDNLAFIEVNHKAQLVWLYYKMYYADNLPHLERKRIKLKDHIKGLKLDKVKETVYTDELIEVCDITTAAHTFNANNIWTKNCDFNAEEIRIPALWSKEPAWVNAFRDRKDVHKSCYSLDTEFLTPDGFKTYDKIGFDDLIAQYDVDLKQVTWVKAGHKYFNESKEMYHFQGTHTDLLVTPNHRMYFKGKDNWFIKRADEAIKKKTLTLITSPNLPSDINAQKEYVVPKSAKKPGISIPTEYFMELMGYLLTDGGTCLKGQGQKVIYLSQSEAKMKVLNKIQELNKNLNFLFTERVDSNIEYTSNIGDRKIKKTKPFHRFETAHTGLYDKLVKDFGGPLKKDRKLPRWFKDLPNNLLHIFLNAYIDGDGSRDKRENRNYAYIYIPNKQMVDDIQYICMKLGYSTYIETRIEDTGSLMYRLGIVPNRREVRIGNNNTELVKYDKPIKSVCFAVPTGLLVVRRNGKVSVCGNTAYAIFRRRELYQR